MTMSGIASGEKGSLVETEYPPPTTKLFRPATGTVRMSSEAPVGAFKVELPSICVSTASLSESGTNMSTECTPSGIPWFGPVLSEQDATTVSARTPAAVAQRRLWKAEKVTGRRIVTLKKRGMY